MLQHHHIEGIPFFYGQHVSKECLNIGEIHSCVPVLPTSVDLDTDDEKRIGLLEKLKENLWRRTSGRSKEQHSINSTRMRRYSNTNT